MATLSQFPNEVARLRERLATLEAQNRALLETGVPSFPAHWRLTAGEARLLAALVSTTYADTQTLLAAARVSDKANDSLVKQLVSTIRRKLAEAGVSATIETVRCKGYRLVGELVQP